jgi:predicted membrane channel-forming protein YqfA (hemolysin III family)
MDNLRYIRETMERSASFTHVSGAGGVAMGGIALAAAAMATTAASPAEWVTIWLVAAGVALGVSVLFMARKSRADGGTLLTGPGRKFAWSVSPPLAAGAVLTVALVRAGDIDMLPGMWLLLYGAGVVAGGSHSVRSIPVMGAGFMVVGFAALLAPSGWDTGWGNVWMAVGFGLLHVAFGAIIWKKHGG